MRQLLQNLIGNALKFQQPGKPPVVRVYGEKVDNVYHLVVEDQGIGFDEKYRERIFAVFQRLHGRTEYEGTGVGLAICRKIAHRHGGDIGATSTPGQGARFVVALPFLHASSHTAEIPTVAPAADLALLNAAIDLNPRVTSTDRRLL